METIGKVLLAVLGSEAIITLIVGAFVTYLVKWLKTEHGEKFAAYEGWAIAAVKAAEKYIQDDTPDKGLRRLDYAMKTFLAKYETVSGKAPNAEEIAKIESWICTVHEVLEEAGALKATKG
jgi:hypothetical protein